MPANSHSRGQSQAQKKAHSCQIAASCSQLMRRGMTLQRLQQRFADCIASSQSEESMSKQQAFVGLVQHFLLPFVALLHGWVLQLVLVCGMYSQASKGLYRFLAYPCLAQLARLAFCSFILAVLS